MRVYSLQLQIWLLVARRPCMHIGTCTGALDAFWTDVLQLNESSELPSPSISV